ncbi:PREDICTED: pentatricopeptide repeat-containing protein At2g22070-like [Tarenaya hassleriana]|uniref:pentatricopeptide repeat-containing protein At2g22070-like n=1 Tax=Tarenaya hassleriana TaxID=28532 RepID=UPI00053C935A|nr:PREDICTED: pentatricopeptide repeat-containing protein At2g22070-like [Tarenaya hassleriana]
MFVRSGRIEEALEFINSMNLQPNEYIWSVILVGCRAQGNTELAFHAAEELLKLKPKEPETYALLLNTYLSAEKLEEVSRLEALINDENVATKENWSWITVKDKVHSFRPDDRTHSRSEEIYKCLEKAQTNGPEIQRVNELETVEGENERKISTSAVVYDSEKLALGLGLLSTPEAAVIRIVKSVNMCSDSHSFMKMVSMLTGRTIVIRDSKRLHRFVDGHCSCGETFVSIFLRNLKAM